MFLFRWLRRAVLLLVLLAVFLGGSVYLFVWQHGDAPTRAGAIVVLSGSASDRYPKGLALFRRGLAPTLVLSDGLAYARRACRRPDVICPRPDPYSTRGEARMIARLARAHDWRTVIVVTSRYHVFRARRIIERCYRGRLELVGSLPGIGRYLLGSAYEWPKLIYAETLVRSC